MKKIHLLFTGILNNQSNHHFRISSILKIKNSAFQLKKAMVMLIMLFLVINANSQNHEWAKSFQAINNYANDSYNIVDVKTDNEGNVYATGSFKTAISTGTDTLAPHYSGSDDIYLAKFSLEGEQIWLKAIGGTWYDFPKSLVVNDSSVLLTSYIQGDIIHIGDTSFVNVTKSSVINFDRDGNFKEIYFHAIDEQLFSISESDSSLYLHSYHNISKFGDFPEVEKGFSFGSSNYYKIMDLHVLKHDKKIITGVFGNNLSYQDTTLSHSFSGSGDAAFIMMLDDQDSLLWAHSFGKVLATTTNPIRVETSSDGRIYLIVNYGNTFDLMGEMIIPYNTNIHSLIACFSSEGELLWNNSMIPTTTSSNSYVRDIHIANDEIFLSGGIWGGMNYAFQDTLLGKFYNSFIIKTDLDGNLIWSDISGSGSGTNSLVSITSDGNGNIFAVGNSFGHSVFGCDQYPNFSGGLLLHMKDEDPDDVPMADFQFKEQNASYFFYSEVENETSLRWDFDDGTGILEDARNPQHTFSAKGEFNVSLIAENTCGEKVVFKTISIDGLKEVFPSVSGRNNLFVGEIHGAGFKEDASFKFVLEGSLEYPIDNLEFISENEFSFSVGFPNVPIGDYDLVMVHDSGNDTLKNALNIEENTPRDIEISVSGPGTVLSNRYFQYRIVVKNNSNVNAAAFPIAIIGKEHHELIMLNEFADDSIMKVVLEELGGRFLSTTLENDETVKIGLFAIPFLRSQETFYIEFAMKTSLNGDNGIKILSGQQFLDVTSLESSEELGEAFGKKSIQSTQGSSCFGSKCADCLMSFTTFVPVLGCATGVVSLGCSVANAASDGSISKGDMFDIGIGVVGTALSCGGAGAAAKAAEKTAKASAQYLSLAAGLGDIGLGTAGVEGACGGGSCDLGDLSEFFFGAKSSLDPNEKYGVKGINEGNYVHVNSHLNYLITFENVDTATAPASEVYVYDTLDISKYNLNTFEWLSFGFGDSSHLIPAGNRNYIADIDLRPERNIILRFEGSLDSTGLILAKFTSLDTLTYELTNDIFDGFLPPNINSPEGEGFIQFSIKAKPDLSHETRIENKATIIFDVNEPIYTGTWLNTIDIESPNSSVLPLAEISEDTIIFLQWQGVDNHSGVQAYDVYMAENHGDYKKILSNISTEEAVLIGEDGKEYSFYVNSKDYAGNFEQKVALEEAFTTVQLINSVSEFSKDLNISVYPVPASDFLNITIKSDYNDEVELKVLDVRGKLIWIESLQVGTESHRLNIDEGRYSSGTYFILLSGRGGRPEIVPFSVIRE